MFCVVNDCFASASYIINHHIIIDPGDIKPYYNKIDTVLLTHAHFDHIYGLNDLFSLAPQAKVYTNIAGKEMLLDAKKNLSFYHEKPFVFDHKESIVTIEDKEKIILGDDLAVTAIFTPGHNPSCITWIVGDALFTGDAYIPGIKTVTNLPEGNKLQAQQSIEIIKDLSKGRCVYPGHKI